MRPRLSTGSTDPEKHPGGSRGCPFLLPCPRQGKGHGGRMAKSQKARRLPGGSGTRAGDPGPARDPWEVSKESSHDESINRERDK